MPDLRHDPATGRWVAIAPERVKRPGGAETPAADEAGACPFCAGHEDQTPPETLRLGDGPTGWHVRVVPNLYPALERQEVVDPRAGARALRRQSFATRRSTSSQRPGNAVRSTRAAPAFPCSTRDARLERRCPTHTHSWPGSPHPRPRPLRSEAVPDTVDVIRLDGVVAGCLVASRVPYELLIAPAEDGDGDWRVSELLAPALRLLAELLRRIQRVRGAELVPVNAWLHDRPRWHLEVLPRITRLAGLELGAGVYINPVEPERASRELAEA